MVVCSCHGVNDRTVAAVIACGADTVEEIAARCTAGGRCGGCWPELQRLLADQAWRDACRDTRAAI